eukprot:7350826-Prymnesium_polylepis.1
MIGGAEGCGIRVVVTLTPPIFCPTPGPAETGADGPAPGTRGATPGPPGTGADGPAPGVEETTTGTTA